MIFLALDEYMHTSVVKENVNVRILLGNPSNSKPSVWAGDFNFGSWGFRTSGTVSVEDQCCFMVVLSTRQYLLHLQLLFACIWMVHYLNCHVLEKLV